ncbi:MAG TPA: molecular chaperone TorD family protein [Anaerolineae bacterium]|nr:molecular chaperone TorD family protein [Anaerolineae bacterium]
MNDSLSALRRSQLYRFLADAFLYPTEDWILDAPFLEPMLDELGLGQHRLRVEGLRLADLQAEHRHVFGLTGSLCYETEYGLPHEYRQSQELADIAGFYRAFGFENGGAIRERPDYLPTELEFMHVLTLREACAREAAQAEHVEIDVDAQRKFLRDHLAHWLPLFGKRLEQLSVGDVYAEVVALTTAFVAAEADRLDARPEPFREREIKSTPFNPDFSCGACLAAENAKGWAASA